MPFILGTLKLLAEGSLGKFNILILKSGRNLYRGHKRNPRQWLFPLVIYGHIRNIWVGPETINDIMQELSIFSIDTVFTVFSHHVDNGSAMCQQFFVGILDLHFNQEESNAYGCGEDERDRQEIEFGCQSKISLYPERIHISLFKKSDEHQE
jgi:hypothetical protein